MSGMILASEEEIQALMRCVGAQSHLKHAGVAIDVKYQV